MDGVGLEGAVNTGRFSWKPGGSIVDFRAGESIVEN